MVSFSLCLAPLAAVKPPFCALLPAWKTSTADGIHLEDHDITHVPAENRHVNTVFQSYALFPHMTVFENVAFGLRMRENTGGGNHPTGDGMPEDGAVGGVCPAQTAPALRRPAQRVAIARAVVETNRVCCCSMSLFGTGLQAAQADAERTESAAA